MTEEEAKTKWCPHRSHERAQGVHIAVLMSGKKGVVQIMEVTNVECIGSACMMWRMTFADATNWPNGKRPITGGYCGLAGKL